MNSSDTEHSEIELSKLQDVIAVAKRLSCSKRTVYRLADAGRMPAPVRIGALVRWQENAITEWIAAGCPTRMKSTRTSGRSR